MIYVTTLNFPAEVCDMIEGTGKNQACVELGVKSAFDALEVILSETNLSE
jgi:hypothetical protein